MALSDLDVPLGFYGNPDEHIAVFAFLPAPDGNRYHRCVDGTWLVQRGDRMEPLADVVRRNLAAIDVHA